MGYGSSVSIKNLVKKVIACSGKTLKINYDLSKPSNKTKVSLDCTKAKTDLGLGASNIVRKRYFDNDGMV